MAALIEAIEIKRKSYFEYENAPYHCLDVDVSKPTARGGQTLVRLKMRNLLTRAVFDKTFKAGDKFKEPDLARVEAIYQYADGDGFHFMDQETFETLTLRPDKDSNEHAYGTGTTAKTVVSTGVATPAQMRAFTTSLGSNTHATTGRR